MPAASILTIMAQTRPLAAAAAVAVATLAFAAAAALSGEAALDASRLALGASTTSVGFLALALAGAFLIPAPLRESLALVRPRTNAASAGRIVAGQLGFGILVSAALAWSGVVEGSSLELADRAMASASSLEIALLAIGVALLPGIGEELLFRGALLGALLPRTAVAVATSTAAFALLHLDPAHILGAAALGLYLAGARIATGSTLVSIACHVAQNAMAIGLSTQHWPAAADWLLIPLALLTAGIGLLEMRRAWPEQPVAHAAGAG